MQFLGLGSMMNVHMHRGPVRNVRDLAQSIQALRELFYFHMLERGVWLARRGMINLSLPLGEPEFEELEAAVASFVSHANALA